MSQESLGFGIMVELPDDLAPLGSAEMSPGRWESKPSNGVLSRVWLNFCRDRMENRNWGAAGGGSFGLLCFHWAFLEAECLKPAKCSCLEEGRPVLSGCWSWIKGITSRQPAQFYFPLQLSTVWEDCVGKVAWLSKCNCSQLLTRQAL